MDVENAQIAKEKEKSSVRNVRGAVPLTVFIVMVMDMSIVIIVMAMVGLIAGTVMALEPIESLMAKKLCVVNAKEQVDLSVERVMDPELQLVKNVMVAER